MILYNLPEEFHTARPKRLCFLLLNTLGKVARHARETFLRRTKEMARALSRRAANPVLPQPRRLSGGLSG